MKNTHFTRSILNVAIASTFLLSQQALGYEAEISEADEKSIERISVTGSRIARINTETPSPVVSLDAQSIKNTGILNINDLLTKMPQFALGNDGSSGNYSFDNAGLNTANLRGLGADRTLTVVNGRRVVQSALDSGKLVTDTAFIPVDLL
ncbi:MAG: iron complex outermembrane receptor protein [Colwellia sp.]|jgi:iron complex outermembrane receptor protein